MRVYIIYIYSLPFVVVVVVAYTTDDLQGLDRY